MLPIDLIIEILQKLPTKTIAKLRCVSKQWGSLLSNPDFTKSFLTCSSTRPRLLFTFEFGGKWHFFSSPQPRNVDEQIIIWVSLEIDTREHKVLMLGKGKPSWRNIECLFPHFPENYKNGICINGILYYIARSNLNTVIACFDVKYEKFRFIQIDEEISILTWFLTLINYKGKLAALVFDQSLHDQLWVLDDPENEKWSKHIFHLPTAAFVVIRSIWATDSGEIVWAPSRWTCPFYVFYYNMERQSVRRFEIKGIEEKALMGHYRPEAIFTFTNHVENVMFL
ncbi:hypothetical protein F2Q69_00030390 [Brassica cretica]|uniref:F-box domain-containing protein n=1 Tax=Brassica cretica TaxID=69181 RepID=A0A8S9RZE5_BRACR|nr:hypothetical protein F2Q69_00030390 [Brassica cretica]